MRIIPRELRGFPTNLNLREAYRTGLEISEEMGISVRSEKCLGTLESVGWRVDFDSRKA